MTIKMGVNVLFYELFQFKDDLAAILKLYCCHHSFHLPGNFLAKGILHVWREKCQEKHFTGN